MYVTVDSAPVFTGKPDVSSRRPNLPDDIFAPVSSPVAVEKSVGRLIDGMVEGRVDVIALQSATSAYELESVAMRIGRRFGLLTGLQRVIKVCGDKSSVEALKRLNIDADIVTPTPYSSRDFASTLMSVPVDGMCVAFIYSHRTEKTFVKSLESRCRSLEEYVLVSAELRSA